MQKRNNNRVRAAAAFSLALLGVGVSALPATAAPPHENPNAGTLVFDPGVLCDFGVQLVVTGKEKVNGPALGNHTVISPNLKFTATALDGDGNPVGASVKYVATGTVFFTRTERPGQDDYFEVKATGNNLLFVPNDPGDSTLFDPVFVTGNVNYAVSLDTNTEVRKFSGAARQVNICDSLG
ncbi:hypothetical protein QFZ23_002184 [Arthrobacter globiformis]|uniref:hypothetical protein n=1 Tax=Arthrobacter globiformis TaxID=1665 RepID=UPI0027839B00|nr:hypothetical protein [Arthrobacter globiformis]MDQ1058283.1 hypothetical protein [Arthrobacter globiformis]